MSDPNTASVIVGAEGRVGRLTLNRPQVLHALNLKMCQAMTEALLAWRDDPAVEAVMIDHAGPRGFCAGGDIRAVAAGDAAAAADFFRAEYRLNVLLYRYPKPVVAVMDGIAMGGGLGLAWPCRYRVATERTLVAMPESAIGLFPDVGMGWRLTQMPDGIGLWFALTGARLGPADALLVGLATDYVPSEGLEALKAGIVADPAGIEALLTELEGDAGEPPLGRIQDDIARLFGRESVAAIMAALEADGSPWAAEQLAALKAASPTTLAVGFRQLAAGACSPSLEDEMRTEFRLAVRIAASHDFREGVRALLVDKDRRPRWSPAEVAGVEQARLDALFAPLSDAQEWTPLT
ncbi:MAG TPA: enoyl-CoA hydratase/isomerase family protein [Caulobacteraceae bacterium]|jgi:enoyl-CoA hydratase|nr:enoyl-CoA hydratase/isomerase family protein [Caulobacteraceae bacterium]